jgi:hypothetical protein
LLGIFVILLIVLDFLLLLFGCTVVLFGTPCGQKIDLCVALLTTDANYFLLKIIL